MLKFDAVTVGYDDIAIVNDITLNVDRGQKISLVGPSGSGKTTILKTIWNEADVLSGSVVNQFDTQSVIFQHAGLFEFLTARENIEVTIKGVTQEQIEQLAIKLGVDQVLDKYVSKLSGGQMQRVQILRALLASSQLLILDEPTSSLDMVNKEMFVKLLIENLDVDTSVVLVTHDLEEAVLLSDYIYVVSNGRIVKAFENIDAECRVRTSDQFLTTVTKLREVILNENH